MNCELIAVIAAAILLAILGVIAFFQKKEFTEDELIEHLESTRRKERERLLKCLDYTQVTEYPESLLVMNFIQSVKARIK
jgi:hypothetical protein